MNEPFYVKSGLQKAFSTIQQALAPAILWRASHSSSIFILNLGGKNALLYLSFSSHYFNIVNRDIEFKFQMQF